VLVRQSDSDWPDLERGHIVIGENGYAILDNGRAISQVQVSFGSNIDGLQQIAMGDLAGSLSADGRIRIGDPFTGETGFWGVLNNDPVLVHDRIEPFETPSVEDLISRLNMEARGCAAASNAQNFDVPMINVTLSGCDLAGEYSAAIVPSAAGTGWDILLANSSQGWRILE